MKLLVELEWDVDGYDSEQEELDAFNRIEEMVDSPSVTLRILSVKKVIDKKFNTTEILSGPGRL